MPFDQGIAHRTRPQQLHLAAGAHPREIALGLPEHRHIKALRCGRGGPGGLPLQPGLPLRATRQVVGRRRAVERAPQVQRVFGGHAVMVLMELAQGLAFQSQRGPHGLQCAHALQQALQGLQAVLPRVQRRAAAPAGPGQPMPGAGAGGRAHGQHVQSVTMGPQQRHQAGEGRQGLGRHQQDAGVLHGLLIFIAQLHDRLQNRCPVGRADPNANTAPDPGRGLAHQRPGATDVSLGAGLQAGQVMAQALSHTGARELVLRLQVRHQPVQRLLDLPLPFLADRAAVVQHQLEPQALGAGRRIRRHALAEQQRALSWPRPVGAGQGKAGLAQAVHAQGKVLVQPVRRHHAQRQAVGVPDFLQLMRGAAQRAACQRIVQFNMHPRRTHGWGRPRRRPLQAQTAALQIEQLTDAPLQRDLLARVHDPKTGVADLLAVAREAVDGLRPLRPQHPQIEQALLGRQRKRQPRGHGGAAGVAPGLLHGQPQHQPQQLAMQLHRQQLGLAAIGAAQAHGFKQRVHGVGSIRS